MKSLLTISSSAKKWGRTCKERNRPMFVKCYLQYFREGDYYGWQICVGYKTNSYALGIG